MALGRTHLPDLEGRESVMAPADKRITIRDKATGDLGHGIEGHVPEGWEKVTKEPVRKK